MDPTFKKPVHHVAGFLLLVLLLAVAFGGTLGELFGIAARTELYSHLFLIPLISAYLVYRRKEEVFSILSFSPRSAVPFFLVGLAALGVERLMISQGFPPTPFDTLSIRTFSFVALLVGDFVLFFGTTALRAARFPVGFLFLLVPIPMAVNEWITTALQHASADALDLMMRGTRTPLLREGLVFHFPGLSVEVAEECSGIRSTLVLFITSLLAGELMLRRAWSRTILAAVVFPIAAFRNGLRILVIVLLTIHVNPDIINGPVHRQGGPPFFALSLIPLFAILLLLRNIERKRAEPPPANAVPSAPTQEV